MYKGTEMREHDLPENCSSFGEQKNKGSKLGDSKVIRESIIYILKCHKRILNYNLSKEGRVSKILIMKKNIHVYCCTATNSIETRKGK